MDKLKTEDKLTEEEKDMLLRCVNSNFSYVYQNSGFTTEKYKELFNKIQGINGFERKWWLEEVQFSNRRDGKR